MSICPIVKKLSSIGNSFSPILEFTSVDRAFYNFPSDIFIGMIEFDTFISLTSNVALSIALDCVPRHHFIHLISFRLNSVLHFAPAPSFKSLTIFSSTIRSQHRQMPSPTSQTSPLFPTSSKQTTPSSKRHTSLISNLYSPEYNSHPPQLDTFGTR